MIALANRRFVNITDDVKLGKDVEIFEFVNLYGCEIGDESRVGAFVEIQRDATIGRRVRIQSHTFICSGVRIEDDVFGGITTFINDRHPSTEARKGVDLKRRSSRRARLGPAPVPCGLTIKAHASAPARS